MTRETQVAINVEKALASGYTLLSEGAGSYNEHLAEYRSLGYDVRCWYTSVGKDKQWVMYGKMKSQKKANEKKSEEIPFEEMSVKELISYCRNSKIKGYSKMSKQQMIESLKKVC